MALSIGAHTSKGYTFNNYTTTDAITTTSGSCIIVAVAYWQGMFPVPVITDSYSNQWIEVGDVYQSSGIPGYAHFYKNGHSREYQNSDKHLQLLSIDYYKNLLLLVLGTFLANKQRLQ